jgi:hypothetical protein
MLHPISVDPIPLGIPRRNGIPPQACTGPFKPISWANKRKKRVRGMALQAQAKPLDAPHIAISPSF